MLPKLSIIIPSYNQGAYIEETLLSIINQNYPAKELIVIDGGSTDNTVDIIKRYEQHITYWVSENDNGQSHAINKGFAKATGDYIAWMNSDDVYSKEAFKVIFTKPAIEQYDFIFGAVNVGEYVDEKAVYYGFNKKRKLGLYNLLHFFYSADYIIPSQSVFIKRDFILQHNIGFLNEGYHYCMDMEWYCRIALARPLQFEYTEALSFFRINNSTKTGSQYFGMQAEAIQVFLNYRKYLNSIQERKMFKLIFYHRIKNALFRNKINVKINSLLAIAWRLPVYALSDKRFLGLFKKALFNSCL